MAHVVKKLNLVRETVRTLNARTGMRAGLPVRTQSKVEGPDDSDPSLSSGQNNGGGGGGSVVQTGTMSVGMEKSVHSISGQN